MGFEAEPRAPTRNQHEVVMRKRTKAPMSTTFQRGVEKGPKGGRKSRGSRGTKRVRY